MRNAWLILKMALRASLWRPTSDPPVIGFPTFVAWCVFLIDFQLSLGYFLAGSARSFNPQGFNALIAWLALSLTLTGSFVRAEMRATFLAAMVAAAIPYQLLNEGLALVERTFFDNSGAGPWWHGIAAQVALAVLSFICSVGATFALLRSVEPERRRQLRRAFTLSVTLLAAFVVFPHYPVFKGSRSDTGYANVWEIARLVWSRELEEPPAPPGTARVELSQPALLEAEISRLPARRSGTTDIYAIGIAGWSSQDVFGKELEGALTSIGRNLPIEGRIVRLINHAATIDNTPIATRQNFAAAVRAVGRIMDKEEDILFLFMTSHGTRRGVALVLDGVVSATLAPEDVAAVLDAEGIKNRILIVSACYSGIFLRPLANDNTIILTAADANNTSFGCANDRDWTYFGDAFFNHSLGPGKDLRNAFEDAKRLIVRWEARDGVSSSNPQGHFGRALLSKLHSANISAAARH